MSALAPGRVIAGRYRLDRPLAKGGMGCVWAGHHLQLDVPVAVKLMTARLAESPDARVRFEREAKASAQLRLPNTVQVYDFGVDGDAPFIVMELLDGEDLEARLAREGRLTLAVTRDLLEPICRVLRVAHESGLVHRDLKPANIFLARQGGQEIVKILDFGIAKVTGPAAGDGPTRTGALLGSPHYMSPEQVRSTRRVDLRTDLWATGVIAFRCLTGRLPFPGEEVGEVLVDICTQPIPAVSGLVPGLGPEIDGFFERALARDPVLRFQSAAELLDAFDAIARGAPAAANAPVPAASMAAPAAPSAAVSAVGNMAVPMVAGAAATPSMAVSAAASMPGSVGSNAAAPAAPSMAVSVAAASAAVPAGATMPGAGATMPGPPPPIGTLSPIARTQGDLVVAAKPRSSAGLVLAVAGGALVLGALALVLFLMQGSGGDEPAQAAGPPPSAEIPVSATPPSTAGDVPSPSSAATEAPSATAASGEAASAPASPGGRGPAKGAPGRARPSPTKSPDDLLNHM